MLTQLVNDRGTVWASLGPVPDSSRTEASPRGPSQASRFRITVTDNGPGIVRQQIPPIFAKLLYGSKFHRLRLRNATEQVPATLAASLAPQEVVRLPRNRDQQMSHLRVLGV